jgi:cyclopropane-fatty-acyl-phospholipid synthase
MPRLRSGRAEAPDTSVEASRNFLESVLADYRPRDFAVRFWNGSTWEADTEPPRFTLVLKHPGALRAMFWPPNELSVAEAYLHDDYDIEGDIEACLPVADYLLIDRPSGARARLKAANSLVSLPPSRGTRPGRGPARLRGGRHSLERARRAVSYHYDLGNEFYALFQDRRMLYSCAYFRSEADSIDLAQEQKLAHICRKLRLRPGERLLDIGCGWGALTIYAAAQHGVEVLGVTLSEPQARLARERVEAAGLAERVQIEVRDYREVDAPGGFDKLVSIGMFEHIAREALPAYFETCFRLLKPGGVFLNHGIGEPPDVARRRGGSFTMAYVFPDCDLVPISASLGAAEAAGFEVRDVESLREHYVLTARAWRRRLEAAYYQALELVDEATYRTWRLAMAGCAYGFATHRLNVWQSLLGKPERGRSGLPLTREDWYA